MNMMSGKSESSFKSYIPELETEANRNEKLKEAYERIYQSDNVDQLLLNGEQIVGFAKKVLKCNVHEDPSRGISGNLACTNFRVFFIASDQHTPDLVKIDLNNQLLGKNNIALNNIESIFVDYPNKRKRLLPESKIKDGIQRLEIHCKNFQISSFSFKLTVKNEEKGVVTAILHHAYPKTVALLPAFDYQHRFSSEQVFKRSRVPSFRCYADWQLHLRKNNLEEGWRVTSVNHSYISETMGKYFVVPKTIKDNVLNEAAPQFINDRLPVWCWSAPSGVSLVRAADLRPDTELGNLEREILKEVEKSGNNRGYERVNLNKNFPTCAQIQQSFNKLKSICMLSTIEDFHSNDTTWLHQLHSSKWLHNVGTFLSGASKAVEYLLNEQNVVVKEYSGIDVTPVVTSLIQLMADPSCRTIIGFKSLVQREWVVGGFPFLDRLGHLHQPSKSKTVEGDAANGMAPVFLLFLDCVWQLSCQYPDAFEFSSLFLTTVYDNTKLLLFDTFIFNNERHRDRSIVTSERKMKEKSWEPIPVWDSDLQFGERSEDLLVNPLYRLSKENLSEIYVPKTLPRSNPQPVSYTLNLSMESLDNVGNESSPTGTQTLNDGEVSNPTADNTDSFNVNDTQLHYNSKTGVVLTLGEAPPEDKKKKNRRFSFRLKKAERLGESDPHSTTQSHDVYKASMCDLIEEDSVPSRGSQILTPNTLVPNLRFWSYCYLRWITWSNLIGGAPFAVYQWESIVLNEIHYLRGQVNALVNEVSSGPENHLVVGGSRRLGQSHGHRGDESEVKDPQEAMPCYFPYSATTDVGAKPRLGAVHVNSSRGNSLFNFTRNKPKHVRSSSDISVPTSYGNELPTSSSLGDVVASSQSLNSFGSKDRKRSSSAQPPKPPSQLTKPTKKVPLMPPRKPLTPPKERITYVSSV